MPWYAAWKAAAHPVVEAQAWYQKQQLSSRTWIRVPNRALPLTIHIQRRSHKERLCDKELSYAENWPLQHLRSLQNAYRNAPFFLFYENELQEFYTQRPAKLLDWLTGAHRLCARWLGIAGDFPLTESYEPRAYYERDLREDFSRKGNSHPKWFPGLEYPQVFEGFVEGLSVLDLLFCTGPEARIHLRRAAETIQHRWHQ